MGAKKLRVEAEERARSGRKQKDRGSRKVRRKEKENEMGKEKGRTQD